jgi:hypothetical protein
VRGEDEAARYVAAEVVVEEPQEEEVASVLVAGVVPEGEASQGAEVVALLLEAEEVLEVASLVGVGNWTHCTLCPM